MAEPERSEQTESPEPRGVPPVLLAALICDVAVRDPSSGKVSLIGVFDRINVRQFPAQHAPTLYLKFTDAEGPQRIRVEFVRTNDDQLLVRLDAEAELQQGADRNSSVDGWIPFPPLPIPSPGRYDVRIHINGVYVGGAFLDAVAM